jgi:glycosyltransferase involved in cell wall biosynthesis
MHGSLRIAVPIHSLEPGGVERVALGLASEWSRAGHDVTIVLGRSGSANLCSAPPLDYWQIPTRLSTASWQTPWMVHCLYSYLVQNRIDVLFCPGNTYAVVAAAVKLLLGDHAPPMVLKISNALNRPDMPPLMRRGYDSWLRVQGSLFDRLVGLSEPMQREIREMTLAGPQQVAMIANPILTRKRIGHLARIERRPASVWGTRYLAAGRIVPQKNYPMLLRAFARAARPDDTLTIAGEGPERENLDRLARELGIAGQIVFKGHQATIDPLLSDADVFVMSSDYEGLPGVVVEALAAGLPVLSTDCCVSMPSLLDHGRTGLLVPTGCEESLAEGLVSIRHFRTDADRARRIAASFELEGAAARYIELMTDLVGERERERLRKLSLSCFSSQPAGHRFL